MIGPDAGVYRNVSVYRRIAIGPETTGAPVPFVPLDVLRMVEADRIWKLVVQAAETRGNPVEPKAET